MRQLQQIWDLNFDFPVIQAPMAGVQDSALAIAVSNAGGIGSLPCAMLKADQLKSELEKIRAATDRPVNINFFCHQEPERDEQVEAKWRALLSPYYSELGLDRKQIPGSAGRAPFSAEIADLVEQYRPEIVSFHFGLPEPCLLDQVNSWGSKIIASATTVAEAQWLDDHGVDAIIAQGIEAGGHRGMFLSDDLSQQLSLAQLLPDVLNVTSLPVIAAGGIADADQVAQCLSLGAAGVQIGTAYLCANEATTTWVHRELLLHEVKQDTAITNLYTGRPARGLINRFISELGPISDTTPAFPLATNAVAPLRKKSLELGLPDFLPLWSGTNQSGCRSASAAEITHSLSSKISALN